MWYAGVDSRLSSIQTCIPHGHLHRVTYTRGRIDTIESPDDEHLVARNMQRIGINKYTKKNCASGWLFTKKVIQRRVLQPLQMKNTDRLQTQLPQAMYCSCRPFYT